MHDKNRRRARDLFLVSAGPAARQWRCDCTSVVDTCSADVVARGSYLEIKTDEAQCARVDYFVDGQPFVSVVVDGEDRQTGSRVPRIRRSWSRAARFAARTRRHRRRLPRERAARCGRPRRRRSGKLEPLIAGIPSIPPQRAHAARGPRRRRVHRQRGRDRRVLARDRGRSRAAYSTPRRLRPFPLALSAVPERAPQRLAGTGRVFTRRTRTPGAGRAHRRAGVRARATMRAAGRVYNYGEMVDVSLINVCGEPLTCIRLRSGHRALRRSLDVQRLGGSGQRLVPANDRRLGTRVSPRGTARHPHVRVYRRLLRDARAELAVPLGRVRRKRHLACRETPANGLAQSRDNRRASTRRRAPPRGIAGSLNARSAPHSRLARPAPASFAVAARFARSRPLGR